MVCLGLEHLLVHCTVHTQSTLGTIDAVVNHSSEAKKEIAKIIPYECGSTLTTYVLYMYHIALIKLIATDFSGCQRINDDATNEKLKQKQN